MNYRDFEYEVIEILSYWLKDCKVMFYFKPIDLVYHCEVYFKRFNLIYDCDIPYSRDLEAKKVTHTLLSLISSFINRQFYRE